jgi:hypothetical protein
VQSKHASVQGRRAAGRQGRHATYERQHRQKRKLGRQAGYTGRERGRQSGKAGGKANGKIHKAGGQAREGRLAMYERQPGKESQCGQAKKGKAGPGQVSSRTRQRSGRAGTADRQAGWEGWAGRQTR